MAKIIMIKFKPTEFTSSSILVHRATNLYLNKTKTYNLGVRSKKIKKRI